MKPSPRYVPPRPNPSPEPWPEPRGTPWAWAVPAPILAAALATWWIRRRRANRPKSLEAGAAEAVGDGSRPIIARSEAVRDALAARFGPPWRARTTEEIAADPALADLIGAAWAAPLLEFLREADRAKFADGPIPDDGEGDGHAAWVAAFLDALNSRPRPDQSSHAQAIVNATA